MRSSLVAHLTRSNISLKSPIGFSYTLNGSIVEGAATTGVGSGFSAGRVAIASNTANGPALTTSTAVENFGGQQRTANPFINGNPLTPFIADLLGGAEGYGLLDGINANSVDFNAIRASAPGNALGALARFDLGPSGFSDNYLGFDMLLLINLSDQIFSDPKLGVTSGASGNAPLLQSLLTGGFASLTEFGGAGASVLGALNPFGIYATLVPEGTAYFGASIIGSAIRNVSLANGDFEYLLAASSVAPVAEPTTLALIVLGLVGLGFRRKLT